MTEITLKGFAEWLAAQPTDNRYSYCDHQGCPIAQYLQSLDLPVHSVTPGYWYDEEVRILVYPSILDEAVVVCSDLLKGTDIYEADRLEGYKRYTFGIAAQRARVLLELAS